MLRRRSGFTLIEILVSIAIIVILLGIVVAVGGEVKNSSARNGTKLTLEQLKSLQDEYKAEVGTYPATGTGPQMATFLTNVKAFPKLNQTLSQLPKDVYDGANVKDGWGNPIEYYVQDTNRPTKVPYFVSEGPDGQLGTSPTDPLAQDNLYSFDQ